MSTVRKCLYCFSEVKGRSDKKFCCEPCRNTYNNQIKSANTFIRNINNALSKNRRILKSMLQGKEETVKTTKEKLIRLGFQFKYLTSLYVTGSGKTYFYCYEYGYLPLENDWYLIVKRKGE